MLPDVFLCIEIPGEVTESASGLLSAPDELNSFLDFVIDLVFPSLSSLKFIYMI